MIFFCLLHNDSRVLRVYTCRAYVQLLPHAQYLRNMPRYKLTYFPSMSLAEPIRFIFSYAGVDFVDDRLDRENWPNLKKTMPFGQVPVLEVDGKKINQSSAICRYLAKQYGLAGKENWENLQIDATVDTIRDLRAKIAAHHYESQAEAKAEKLDLAKELVPFYVERLDQQAKNNGGYLVGGKLTWADLTLVAFLDNLNSMAKYDIIEKAENLKALRDKVLSHPGIKAWIEKRPKTEF